MSSIVEKMLKYKQEFIPDEGYSLLGIDGMALPGEDQLYNISWHPTLEEAKAAGRELEQNDIDSYFILDKNGVGYEID